jgi:hypothetical protein
LRLRRIPSFAVNVLAFDLILFDARDHFATTIGAVPPCATFAASD